jgi:putative DNA primase/helicase
MSTPKEPSPVERILALLDGVREGQDGWTALCPAHDDTRPSLSIAEGHDGRCLVYCHAGCATKDVVEVLGLSMWDLFPVESDGEPKGGVMSKPSSEIETVYPYVDEVGELLFEVVRYRPKDFRPRRQGDDGRWIYNLTGVRRVLYRLRDVMMATHVIFTEGEKDADRVRRAAYGFDPWKSVGGWAVTTCAGGTGGWRPEFAPFCAGKTIYILPHNDKAGREFAQRLARDVSAFARKVKIVELPDLPQKGDASDYLESHDPIDLQEELRRAPLYQAPVPKSLYDASSFNVQPLRDYYDEPEEEQRWIVDGLFPAGGMSLLTAKPKVGKTTLSRQLALDVAAGEPFLERATEQGSVIILALEEKRAEVKRHFRDLGATGDEPIRIHCAPAPVKAMEQARNLLREYPATKLLIIDPLFKFARVQDGNDYAQVTLALEPLLALARETGTHVMLVHHCRKGQLEDAADGILGSTAIFANADTAVVLKRYDDQVRTILTRQRYGTDLDETVLEFDATRRATTLGTTRQQAEQDKLGRKVLAFLQANPGSPEAEILKAGLGRRQNMVTALRAMIGREVVRTGKGGKTDPYRYSYSAEPRSEFGTTTRNSLTDPASQGKILVPNGKGTSGNKNGQSAADSKPSEKVSDARETRPRTRKRNRIEWPDVLRYKPRVN